MWTLMDAMAVNMPSGHLSMPSQLPLTSAILCINSFQFTRWPSYCATTVSLSKMIPANACMYHHCCYYCKQTNSRYPYIIYSVISNGTSSVSTDIAFVIQFFFGFFLLQQSSSTDLWKCELRVGLYSLRTGAVAALQGGRRKKLACLFNAICSRAVWLHGRRGFSYFMETQSFPSLQVEQTRLLRFPVGATLCETDPKTFMTLFSVETR